jgi:hypothetical protein
MPSAISTLYSACVESLALPGVFCNNLMPSVTFCSTRDAACTTFSSSTTREPLRHPIVLFGNFRQQLCKMQPKPRKLVEFRKDASRKDGKITYFPCLSCLHKMAVFGIEKREDICVIDPGTKEWRTSFFRGLQYKKCLGCLVDKDKSCFSVSEGTSCAVPAPSGTSWQSLTLLASMGAAQRL